MVSVYLNEIAVSVPEHNIHQKFVDYAVNSIFDECERKLFKRMAERSHISHRYSVLASTTDSASLDGDEFYMTSAFPDTARRMKAYEKYAFALSRTALDKLNFNSEIITHIIITSCTGFYAPGLDLEIIEHYGLQSSVERNFIGFMGCNAGINALKMAHHIVRSAPESNVLVVNIELCTLHLQETKDLEQLLLFLIFSDGCAVSLISAKPIGIEMKKFYSSVLPNSNDQITWNIGSQGFDMALSGKVPSTIARYLPGQLENILHNNLKSEIYYWAIHPGGRSILDAVEKSLDLDKDEILLSYDILQRYGNMSSATIMFVLHDIMQQDRISGLGCAMAFGPGVTIESMLFHVKAK